MTDERILELIKLATELSIKGVGQASGYATQTERVTPVVLEELFKREYDLK